MVATWSNSVVTKVFQGITVWKPTIPASGASATWRKERAGRLSM